MPFLLFSHRNEIFSIDSDGTNFRTVARNTGSLASLDFDHQEQRVYWLDLSKGFLQRVFLNGTKREVRCMKIYRKNEYSQAHYNVTDLHVCNTMDMVGQ